MEEVASCSSPNGYCDTGSVSSFRRRVSRVLSMLEAFFFVVLVVVASPYFEPCSGTVMQSIKGNAEVLKAFRKRRVFRIMRGGGKGEVDSLCAGWGENEVVKGEGRKLD